MMQEIAHGERLSYKIFSGRNGAPTPVQILANFIQLSPRRKRTQGISSTLGRKRIA
jgi:hypothetical protein